MGAGKWTHRTPAVDILAAAAAIRGSTWSTGGNSQQSGDPEAAAAFGDRELNKDQTCDASVLHR